MYIGFVTAGLTFAGDSIEHGALGGSETAMICVARELKKRGHRVRVYCTCDRPGIYDGVEYMHRDLFLEHCAVIPFDVLVVSRWFQYLTNFSPAGLKVLWNHDVLVEPEAVMSALWQTDLVMCLSDYHVDDYCGPPGADPTDTSGKKLPFIRPHVWKTSNGVEYDRIKKCIKPKIPGKVIYTSRPERGLLYLLRDIMPKLLEVHPKLKLHYCCYELDENMEVAPSIAEVYKACDYFAQQLGDRVVNMRQLNKDTLYREISSSQLYLYPCIFPEIFGIGLIETQACGTPAVTSNEFALKETAGDGCVKIPGTPETDPEYLDRFIESTLLLLEAHPDPDKGPVLSEEGCKLAERCPDYVEKMGYTWERVAASWDHKFTEMLADRFRERKGSVIKELLRNNDMQVAKILAQKEGRPEVEVIEKYEKALPTKRTVEQDQILPGYQDAQKTHQTLLDIISAIDPQPTSFLEYNANEVAFGMVVKRSFPNFAVTLCAHDSDAEDNLKLFCGRSAVDITVTTEEYVDEKYDVVFVPEQVDMVVDPQGFLTRIRDKYLNEHGSIIFTTRYGPETLHANSEPTRRWNFDARDIEEILGGDEQFFHVSFVDGRHDPHLDVTGTWCVLARDTKKFKNIDVQSKARRTRPYASIAATMITKNEEENVIRAINSLKPIADRIVVTDSQSTDRTREFAASVGAEVKTIEFNNFAQAKNAAFEGLSEDWILNLDADEVLLNAPIIHRYAMGGPLFNGFALKQQHLQIDVPGAHDLPIRVFRNKEYYRYVGLIHEHVEDLRRAQYDNPVYPTLVIDEADIAHYGYANETVRRVKCSFRNIELLIRELEHSKGERLLDWVLVIRDFINILKWRHTKDGSVVVPGTVDQELLNAAVRVYLTKFHEPNIYTELAYGLYQDALNILAFSGLAYPGRKLPPFQVELSMAGSVGGLSTNRAVEPKRCWFLDEADFIRHVGEKSQALLAGMHVAEGSEDRPFIVKTTEYKEKEVTVEEAIRLLKLGECTNVIY